MNNPRPTSVVITRDELGNSSSRRFSRATIPPGADAYLFRHIIHDWTDEQCVTILSHCRKVIPNNGRLLIIEAVVPEGNEPCLAKDFDMTMMTLPGGIERTAMEYRLLLEQAGFRLTTITPTPSMVSVIESIPG